ncbi:MULTISPECIES: hypothetical protein [unclassified Streptomyces]|uniref:hypothetical protein n=1 Tax=unclassified Streptomyces TaxID=2593676 RepID=UPI001CD55783|nr:MULTISPECIES: hypothetical protein [unclassified Streptomyces]
MSERLVIDCHALYERMYRTADGMHAVQTWLRANGIDPKQVPVYSELVITDSAFGMVIRYEVHRTTPNGRLFPDPHHPDRLATQGRTALLRLPPPPDWPTATGSVSTAAAR